MRTRFLISQGSITAKQRTITSKTETAYVRDLRFLCHAIHRRENGIAANRDGLVRPAKPHVRPRRIQALCPSRSAALIESKAKHAIRSAERLTSHTHVVGQRMKKGKVAHAQIESCATRLSKSRIANK